MTLDAHLLHAALVGYQAERDRIEAAIAGLQKRIGKGGAASAAAAPAPKTRSRRHMSADARRRIAEAQKKRWAEYHKKHGK
jgi:hypothetical protein